MNGFFNYFAGSVQYPITMTVMMILSILVFIGLLLFMPLLGRKVFPKFGYLKYSD